MQFREVTYNQQLQLQRLVHGPEADITERSLPNLPGTAMRDIIKHSQHPQNLEQVLLTLRRPANSATRRNFAGVGGELVLIQKITSSEPVVSDFKIAHFGQVMDLPEGMLYPVQSHTTLFETWLRVEMLDALRMMVEENLVQSLLPEMQLKLIEDMLQLSEDTEQPDLIRLYSFSVAVAGVKRFHAARAAAIAGGFPAKTAAFLQAVLDGPHAEDSIYSRDPFEQIKALAAAAEALYLVAVTNKQGEYTLAAPSTAAAGQAGSGSDPAAAIKALIAEGGTLEGLDRSLEGLPLLQELGAGPLLSRAIEKLWGLLQERDNFTYVLPASLAARAAEKAAAEAAAGGDNSSSDAAGGEAGSADAAAAGKVEGPQETEEQKRLRDAAEDAVAMSQVTFEENWRMFLKAVYDTELVPVYVGVGIQLAAALLQLLVHKTDGQALPVSPEVLKQVAAYSKHPVLPITGSILEGMVAAGGSSGGSIAAIMALPGHQDIELSVLAKSCCCCNKTEGEEVKLLRCGQCGCTYYCGSSCQKADWKVGHKGVCKQLSDFRTAHLASSNGNSGNGNGASS